MSGRVIEIACREGAESRSVRLTCANDGAITMDAQDIGPSIAAVAGDDEYEFWVTIASTELPKLAFELLREKFAGQLDAVDAFRDWCKVHGVEHRFGNWV